MTGSWKPLSARVWRMRSMAVSSRVCVEARSRGEPARGLQLRVDGGALCTRNVTVPMNSCGVPLNSEPHAVALPGDVCLDGVEQARSNITRARLRATLSRSSGAPSACGR